MRPAPLLVKIDRRRSAARSRRAEPQTSPPHATRLRALGRRHSLSTVAPPRRAARRPAPVQGAPWLCSSGAGRRRGRAAAARAVSAERVHTRTAQNEICGFGAAGGPIWPRCAAAKSAAGRCAAPARRPQKPAGTLRLALLRPLKNPLRGSRPTWAVWAPRRRRPPDRSALCDFFDSQSNMGLPRHQRRPAPPPEPVGREGTTLGAHATVADALHVVGRQLGPQLHHSNGGVPPGADQSQRRRSPPSQRTPPTRRTPGDVAMQQHALCTIRKGNVI